MPVFRSEYPNTEIVVDLQEIEKINVHDVNNCRNFATKKNMNEIYEIAKNNQRLTRGWYESYNN